MGGVPLRFPELRFAFQEGGTAWACNVYSDVIGHWEKRNAEAVTRYDPAELDREMLDLAVRPLRRRSSPGRLSRLDEGLGLLSEPMIEGASIDDFAESLLSSLRTSRTYSTPSSSSAARPMTPWLPWPSTNASTHGGARTPALFASDIGHRDVPDFCRVLEEAWEPVEQGLLDPEGFRHFTFANPVRLWAGTNPGFFEGTSVEEAVREELTRL